MWRKLLAALILVACMASGVYAQGDGPSTQHSDPFWQVTYWNNVTLSGDPAYQGQTSTLGGDWGEGSPRTGVNVDRFSARWSRYVDLGKATYRFAATSDDGIRLYVDGSLLIDR